MSKKTVEMLFLVESPKTVTTIVQELKACHRYEIFLLQKQVLIQIQDYEEQYPYLVLVDKSKWMAICCLMWDFNCGGGTPK